MRLLFLCLFLFNTAGSLADDTETIIFKDRGVVLKQLSIRELKRLVAVQTVTVLEPHEKQKIAYRGFSFNELLKVVYGNDWKKREELLITCVDGYQPSISVARFEQFPAYLVFERENQKEFSLTNTLQGNEKVDLGPLYMVWDNISHPIIQKDGALTWPYQVTTLDLIQFSDRFPKMSPPKKSSASVHKGFTVFRRDCLACHTINGEGGAKGVELNFPASATEYFQPEWLRRWILDPSSVRFGSAMPAFNKQKDTWKQDLDDLIAYLKEMAKYKKAPN